MVLWALAANGRPLSLLNTLDVAEYLAQFVAEPQLIERWIGRRRVERFVRPGGRSPGRCPSAAATWRSVIPMAMGAKLARQQYLQVNPFDGLAAAAPVPIDTANCTRTHAQWRYVLQTV